MAQIVCACRFPGCKARPLLFVRARGKRPFGACSQQQRCSGVHLALICESRWERPLAVKVPPFQALALTLPAFVLKALQLAGSGVLGAIQFA